MRDDDPVELHELPGPWEEHLQEFRARPDLCQLTLVEVLSPNQLGVNVIFLRMCIKYDSEHKLWNRTYLAYSIGIELDSAENSGSLTAYPCLASPAREASPNHHGTYSD